MATFDTKAAVAIAGQGDGLGAAIGTGFGVPSCLLNLGLDVLKLIPTPVLYGIQNDLQNATAMADDVVKSIFSQVRNIFGIIEWDSEEGLFKFVSNSSKMGFDAANALGSIGAFVGGLAALGGQLYAAGLAAVAQVQQIKDCLTSYRDYLKFRDGNAGEEISKLDPVAFEEYINKNYELEKEAIRQSLDFINRANNVIADIQDVIFERINDPSLEPKFNCSAINFFSGTPLSVNCEATPVEPVEIFRLVYGPPRSTFGQFVLSKDGIYFDSQTSGITPALVYIDSKIRSGNAFRSLKWKFEHSPNTGGRGDAFSTEDLKDYVKTILDPTIIDDSPTLRPYYEKDGFLQELIGNKNKRIYDLSAQISDLELEAAPESIIDNFKQSLVSENTSHQEKINKRKKQIELAVVLPQIYGTGFSYKPGEIPINDFSYLSNVNLALDIQKQKKLSFSQVDIADVVSPLQLSSAYVVSKVNNKNSSMEHLVISELGDGAIIYDGSSVSATDAVILPAESFITTDSIIAMYNFLDTNIQDPSSTVFNSRNALSETDERYGQLVAEDQSFVFRPGLAIPYLQGITKHSSTNPQQPSALGSYFRLPSEKKFNDLLYNKTGASIDFWVHAPNLLSIDNGYDTDGVSSLYRLVLANENTGYFGIQNNQNIEASLNDFGDKSVRGFMMGFTRDRRLTSNLQASNDSDENPVNESVFFIAPTQSISTSATGLINRSYYDNELCASNYSFHSMTHKIFDSNLSSCEGEFCHIAVTFDPDKDEINFYLDGSLLTTSSMSYVFGIEKNRMPRLPSFKRGNSFEYNTSSVGPAAPENLKYGPKLDRYFTPWIVGGGYTDGMYYNGNFMGGDYGGVISGLRGYLGSLKFYSKPLSSDEVLNNYKAQRGFFKHIDTLYLGWEEIISS